MNAYLPICAITFALCATAFALPEPEPEPENSTETESSVDKFYEHFNNGSDVQAMLDEAMQTMDTVTQYKHFQYIEKLASVPNPKQQFANQVLQAAQDRLDGLLQQIGYDGQVDVKKYIAALYEMKTTRQLRDQELFKQLEKVSKLQGEYVKKTRAEREQSAVSQQQQVTNPDESVQEIQSNLNQSPLKHTEDSTE